MMNRGFIEVMGRTISSQKIVPQSKAPVNTSRGVWDLELEKDKNCLNADIQSVIYLHQRGVLIAN